MGKLRSRRVSVSESARQANLSLADSHRSKRNTLLSLGFREMSNVALMDQPVSLDKGSIQFII